MNSTAATVKDMIKLRELQKQRIESLWCETQQEDIQRLIDLMENVASSAIGCSNSMGMDLLRQAKKEFIETLLDQSERYRCVVPEKV